MAFSFIFSPFFFFFVLNLQLQPFPETCLKHRSSTTIPTFKKKINVFNSFHHSAPAIPALVLNLGGGRGCFIWLVGGKGEEEGIKMLFVIIVSKAACRPDFIREQGGWRELAAASYLLPSDTIRPINSSSLNPLKSRTCWIWFLGNFCSDQQRICFFRQKSYCTTRCQ